MRTQATSRTCFPLLALLWLLSSWCAAQQTDFRLTSVSAATAKHADRLGEQIRPGQELGCQTEPDADVKKYPPFSSARPLFGSVTLARNELAGEAGTTFHFAIDESAGAATALARRLGRRGFYRYDRLYFDFDRDLDLTNDAVMEAAAQIPAEFALAPDERTSSSLFRAIDVALGEDNRGAGRSVALIPLLSMTPQRQPDLLILMPRQARQGKIVIGGEPFQVLLSQVGRITGGLDHPLSYVRLTHGETLRDDNWWVGSQWLGAMRRVGDQWYQLSATADGERISVRRYDGLLGALEVHSPHTAGPAPFSGSLFSKSQVAVPVGQRTFPPASQRLKTAQIPVGQYLPLEVTAEVGRTLVRFGMLTQSAMPNETRQRWPAYGVKIDESQACVMRLSTQPRFYFPAPYVFESSSPRPQVFRPGDDIRVDAQLIDPQMGLVTGLWRAEASEGESPLSRQLQGQAELFDAAGTKLGSSRVSLGDGTFFYRWRIPPDLPMAGRREVLTIRFTADTLDLYGRVQGEAKIVVEAARE